MRRLDEKGVSPVIGVILMVAITVILAAVIASFVFGMGQSVKRTYNVAAVAQAIDSDGENDGTDAIVITYHGGPDAQYVTKVTYSIDGEPSTELCSDSSGVDCEAGVSAKYPSLGTAGAGEHSVIVAATFQDGTEQVILSTSVVTAE